MPSEGSQAPHERQKELSHFAREWMGRARSNLALAMLTKPAEVVWEDLCFEAQQAAEKAIKAVLVRSDIEFPKTHDIGELLDLLERGGEEVPPSIREADTLNPYAVATRYPEHEEKITEFDLGRAVELAKKVVEWAETRVKPE